VSDARVRQLVLLGVAAFWVLAGILIAALLH